jgi:hypothetical protein
VDRFSRLILGYHGCSPAFAEALLLGKIPIRDWTPSRNGYDWLGQGIYFWEHGPERARDWGEGAVIGAVIQLGECFDLTDTTYTELLADEFVALRQKLESEGLPLPVNEGKLRSRDCLILNQLLANAERAGVTFQTVRGPFIEGPPAFEGSPIRTQSHIQLAVRDIGCILGVFRPNLD